MKLKLVLTCLSLGLLAVQPLAGQATNPSTLTGSWQLTFVAAGPPASTPPAVPLPGLATFTPAGSVIETDSTEAVPTKDAVGNAIYSTPAHGVWQPGPALGSFFIQFISLMVNRNTTLHAKKIVTITGTLDGTGNQFSGHYSFKLVDPTAHVITTGSGTVTGQRIPHPLLP